MAELLLDHHRLKRREPATAKFFGNVHAIEPQRLRLLEDRARGVVRQNAGFLDPGFQRRKLILDEAAHGIDQHPLLVGDFKIHRSFPVPGPALSAAARGSAGGEFRG